MSQDRGTQEHEAAAETLLREWYDTTSVGRADVHWSARERLSTMIAAALADAVRVAREEEREACARLHENIDPACDHERLAGNPGSAAMGAIVKYRDAIRGRSKWADRKRVGEGDATPGPEPACSWCGMVGVQHVDPCEATPPKKGRD